VTFAGAFAGHDPLFRHVRTRVRSPRTKGVAERFFGTLKYEHLDRHHRRRQRPGRRSQTCSATPTTLRGHTRPSTNAHRARLTWPSNAAMSVSPWADPL